MTPFRLLVILLFVEFSAVHCEGERLLTKYSSQFHSENDVLLIRQNGAECVYF